MKKSRFSDSQILAILKQAEGGVPVTQLCREHGISSATFYKWRSKFGGMDASLMARMKELEEENRRLNEIYLLFRRDSMTQEERRELIQKLEDLRKELKESPEKSLTFLEDVGILDEDGNLTEQYKNLRIPKDR